MRKILFIFTATTIIIFIIVVFIAVSFFQGGSQNTPNPALPTKAPGSSNNSGNQVVAPVQWDSKKSEELVDAADNRESLSQNGTAAKQKLIALVNNVSGTVYVSQAISIDYIKTPDLFQVQINTGDVAQAKQEAVNYMITQGFSKDDLCKLPLSFYLSPQVSQQLQETQDTFNPRPDGC